MTEEKRGFIGRNKSLSNDVNCTWLPVIGTSISKTARIDTDNTELLKYCPIGLIGSVNPSFNSIMLFVFLAFNIFLSLPVLGQLPTWELQGILLGETIHPQSLELLLGLLEG
ncbi:hypothetical protein FH972_014628 [Carpinus fangiana]|uniref:Uncharacterized protein n=1 Tax=Carpinus fangiana TaxID=176857 RepID=A0A5N6RD14_9ROSI|nr:hypothetical protein FH972_014628 [Carpinus fangiana]